MEQKDIELVKNRIRKGFPEVLKGNVRKIIIYGSCARGDFDDDSDIDVAVLTECSREAAKVYDSDLMDIVTEIAMQSDAIVEYVCIPYDEYQEKKDWYGYFKNIERDGVLIYG